MIGGPGIQTSVPNLGYPLTFGGNVISAPLSDNYFDLPAGGALLIPPGRYLVYAGKYSWLQFYDPIMQSWVMDPTVGASTKIVNSDGASWRLWNPLGCPVGALITNVGSGYATASTTVTPSAGASTWRAVVGGAISTTITITSAGTNFTYRPTIVIDAPPVGGVPAAATCTISAGAINAVTVTNQGAGYVAVPGVRVVPHPLDPNFGTITAPTLTAALASQTTGITAILPVAPGTVGTAAPTLTLAGAGSSATAVAVMALTVTGVSLSSSGGVAYPGSAIAILAVGGDVTDAAGAVVNPRISTGLYTPRSGVMYAAVSGGAAGTADIIDGGMFQIAPVGITLATSVASAALPTTATAATFTMGSVADRVYMQAVT